MADFTSALYLGMRHPSTALPPWERLTSGRPAVLGEPPRSAAVAAELAALQGCERALLLPSTLHLFMDLFEVLAAEPLSVYLDGGSYPIARWGAERIAARGTALRVFPHHDAGALTRLLRSAEARPVVVSDGFCPDCGRPAPLGDYLAAVRHLGGLLVVDDTQALGILGSNPEPAMPLGRGGGGSLAYDRLRGPDILVGASLAKGFGVPVAALSGAGDLLSRFAAEAATRLHCSPPSAAAVHAAWHALAMNRQEGDGLRRRLVGRVRQFRDGLRRLGLPPNGGLFPVQILAPPRRMNALSLHRALWRRGVRAVPLRRRGRGDPGLGFLITARHSADEIEHCLSVLARVTGKCRPTGRSPTEPAAWGLKA